MKVAFGGVCRCLVGYWGLCWEISPCHSSAWSRRAVTASGSGGQGVPTPKMSWGWRSWELAPRRFKSELPWP